MSELLSELLLTIALALCGVLVGIWLETLWWLNGP